MRLRVLKRVLNSMSLAEESMVLWTSRDLSLCLPERGIVTLADQYAALMVHLERLCSATQETTVLLHR
jgi:hypothetical protein